MLLDVITYFPLSKIGYDQPADGYQNMLTLKKMVSVEEMLVDPLVLDANIDAVNDFFVDESHVILSVRIYAQDYAEIDIFSSVRRCVQVRSTANLQLIRSFEISDGLVDLISFEFYDGGQYLNGLFMTKTHEGIASYHQ